MEFVEVHRALVDPELRLNKINMSYYKMNISRVVTVHGISRVSPPLIVVCSVVLEFPHVRVSHGQEMMCHRCSTRFPFF